MAAILINGKLQPPEHACIPVYDHGFLYGDGVFEGLRFYNGRILKKAAHLDRLQDSAQALRLEVPYSRTAIEGWLSELIDASETENGYIRLIVTRGSGPLGIDPAQCSKGNLVMIADRLSMVSQSIRTAGATLIITSNRRYAADQLDARIKSLNYLNQIMARLEANDAKADEALVLNQQGNVAEGSADNVFIIKNQQLITPPTTDGALDGITRGMLIELAKKQGIDVSIQSIAPYDIFTADECFLTGTGAELIPVRQVAGRLIKSCPGEVYKKLEIAFQEALTCDEYFND